MGGSPAEVAARSSSSFEEHDGDVAGVAGGVDSLGHALAGVSLSSSGRSPKTTSTTTTTNNNTTSNTTSHSPENAFFGAAHNGGGGAVVGNHQDTSSGWGTFTDVSESAFGTGASPHRQHHDHHSSNNGTVGSSNNDAGLELFLSRDPSHTLGENVLLKLSSHNLNAMGEESNNNNNNNTNASNNNGANKTHAESPESGAATARTAASSQSDSPAYHNRNQYAVSNHEESSASHHHTIEAFQEFDHHGPHDYSFGGAGGAGVNGLGGPPPSSPAYHHGGGGGAMSSPSITSPYAKQQQQNMNKLPQYAPPQALYENTFAGMQPVAPQQEPVAGPPGQQQQILYMAVPSPDGRGQVLQPVQMVPLPGSKQMAYVVAGPAGGIPEPPLDPYAPLGSAPNPLGSSVIGTPPDLRNSNPRGGGGASSMMNGGYGSVDTTGLMGARSPYSESKVGGGGGSGGGGGDDFSLNSGGGGSFQATDPTIASLYASPQRPPLDALLGQVRRLSRDQVGCRLVQQALDEEGPMAASLILQEGLSFWGEAMVDPFGNYLFQKILEKVTPEERVLLVKSVSTRLVNASLNLHGTRSVQKVVELCAADEATTQTGEESAADILTQALTPAAARLCIDSHGNHVIQRIILKLGPKHAEFVFDAVATSVGDVARHRHGCCVIQRCLDSPPSSARSQLVRCIIDKSLELMQDAYGNYVVQYVLDVCSDEDVHAVCESVTGKVNLLAIQKFSSNVMEKCLERCSERVKECYMMEMSDPERIRELMMDPFGNYVVQRALSVATHAQAIRLVEAMRPHLVASTTTSGSMMRNGGVRNTAGGRRIIAKICRRFPNFTLAPPGSTEQQQPPPQDLYRRGGAPGPGGAGGGGQQGHYPQAQHHGGQQQHHHHHHPHHHQQQGGHHHQQQNPDELYSRNKNRHHYQQQQPFQQQSLLTPTSFAVGPPGQSHEQLWKAPEQDQRGYVAPPAASPASASYYNPLGGQSYYDPFAGGLGGGGGFHGAF